MAAVQTVEHPTFETVWAALQEVAKSQKETDRQMKETDRKMQETDRIMKENAEQQRKDSAEWKEQKEDFNTRLGEYINLFGEVTEYMMAPKLREKFRETGLDFPQTSRNTKVNDRVNDISFETDVKLENGDKAMLVKVKTKLTIERINRVCL
jgi:hypothetical protein